MSPLCAVSVVDVYMSISMNMNMNMHMHMHSRRMQGSDRQGEIVAGLGARYPERKF